MERVILGLWSLAVMDKLRPEHAKLVLPQLQQFVAAKSKQLPDKVVRQLQQVLLDLKLKAQKSGEESNIVFPHAMLVNFHLLTFFVS